MKVDFLKLPSPLSGRYGGVEFRSQYMASYENRLSKMRHTSMSSFKKSIDAYHTLKRAFISEMKPLLTYIDEQHIASGLTPRYQAVTFLENKGKCGHTSPTTYSLNVIKYIISQWDQFDGVWDATQPLHRLLGWPWEATWDRGTNVVCMTALTSAYVSSDLRPQEIVAALEPLYGPIRGTYLHRYQDGSSNAYAGIGPVMGESRDAMSACSTWAYGPEISMKARMVGATPKGVGTANKMTAAYFKDQLFKSRHVNPDRSFQERWAKETLKLARNRSLDKQWACMSLDMVNYDKGQLGFVGTSAMWTILAELIPNIDFASIEFEYTLPIPSPYNGDWLSVSGMNGMSSGVITTTVTGIMHAMERLTKMGFWLYAKTKGTTFDTGQSLDSFIDQMSYSRFKLIMDERVWPNYDFLDMSDDAVARTNMVPLESTLGVKDKAMAMSEYCNEYWALYNAELSLEPGLSFLGQSFTDDLFDDNPYGPPYSCVGRWLVKMLVDEWPKEGIVSLLAVAARSMMISKDLKIVIAVLKAFRRAQIKVSRFIEKAAADPELKLFVKQYDYLSTYGAACEMIASIMIKRGSEGVAELVNRVGIKLSKQADGLSKINHVLQMFLKGSDDESLLPDELKHLMPFAFAPLHKYTGMDMINREIGELNRWSTADKKMATHIKFLKDLATPVGDLVGIISKRPAQHTQLKAITDCINALSFKLVANKMGHWERGYPIS